MLVKLESEINETSAKCWEDSAPLRSQLENELCTKPLPLAAGHYEGLTQHRPKKRRKSENPNGREVRPSLSLAVRLQKVNTMSVLRQVRSRIVVNVEVPARLPTSGYRLQRSAAQNCTTHWRYSMSVQAYGARLLGSARR